MAAQTCKFSTRKADGRWISVWLRLAWATQWRHCPSNKCKREIPSTNWKVSTDSQVILWPACWCWGIPALTLKYKQTNKFSQKKRQVQRLNKSLTIAQKSEFLHASPVLQKNTYLCILVSVYAYVCNTNIKDYIIYHLYTLPSLKLNVMIVTRNRKKRNKLTYGLLRSQWLYADGRIVGSFTYFLLCVPLCLLTFLSQHQLFFLARKTML